MLHAIFLPGIDPSGRVVEPVKGRLSCPHCGEPLQNPNDGFFNTWTPKQVRALAAMKASRVCPVCDKPSRVVEETL
jgi:hypothetical protein